METLEAKRQHMTGQVARVLFLLRPTQGLPANLETKLHQEGQLLRRADIDLPPESDSFGLRLRRWYGKLQGKAVGDAQPGLRKFTVELYVLNPR